MRDRFEQQMTLGTIPIGETKITTRKRTRHGPVADLCNGKGAVASEYQL